MAAPPTTDWKASNGVTLKIWRPPPDQPHLLAWWWPLHRLLRAVWFEGITVFTVLEDFALVGRVVRSGTPDLWIYRHHGTNREAFCDDGGRAHELRPMPSNPTRGRFYAWPAPYALARVSLRDQPTTTWTEELAKLTDSDVQQWSVPLPGALDLDAGSEAWFETQRQVFLLSTEARGERPCGDPSCLTCEEDADAARSRIAGRAPLRREGTGPWDGDFDPSDPGDQDDDEDQDELYGYGGAVDGLGADGLTECERLELAAARRQGAARSRPQPGSAYRSKPAGGPTASDGAPPGESGRPDLRLLRLGSDPFRPRGG